MPNVPETAVPSRLRAVAGLVLAAVLLSPGPADTQGLDANLWVTNGTVSSVLRTGNTVYVGGTFDYVGPSTGGGVPVGLASGAPSPSFPRVEGPVLAVIPDGAGGWYIGGDFDVVGGQPRTNLAHVASDLSVTAWAPNPNGYVFSLALSGSTVYVGGNFSTIGGQSRSRIAALSSSTGLATAWNPTADSDVWALAVSGGTVYAGGYFSNIGGQARNRIAALSATTGLATSWNPNAGAGGTHVLTFALGTGVVYAGGSFSSIGGTVRLNLAALDATTGTATAWNPAPDAVVEDLLLSGTTLYAGGRFSFIGGQARNYIAAIRTTNGTATSWNPNANNWVISLGMSGGTVFAGGSFTTIGGQSRSRVAALDASGAATAWNPSVSNSVYGLAAGATHMFVGGLFSSMGGQARLNLAALDATTGAATAWNPQVDGAVQALAASGSLVYAGGAFTSVGVTHLRSNLAAIDATTGTPTSWNPSANDAVKALLVSDGVVYAGGDFTIVGGQPRNRIGAINASGLATSWNPNSNGTVHCLAVDVDRVYAGGSFTGIGGATRNGVAALNKTTGAPTPWSTGTTNGKVSALAVRGGTVYAGGAFTMISGQSRNYIAALKVTDGLVQAWNPGADAPVNALAVDGSALYVGGEFTALAGVPRTYLGALNANGDALTWTPGPSFYVYAVSVAGGKAYAGGVFSWFNSLSRSSLAGVFAIPEIDVVSPTSGGNNGVVTLSLTGRNFQAGSTVKLMRDLYPDIDGFSEVVATDGLSLTASLDLSGREPGPWAVVVEEPDLQFASIPNAFTIETLEAPQMTVSIVGPDPMRAGVPTAFDIVIENPGNLDAEAVPVWVTGIPTSATVSLGFVSTPPPQSGGEPNWSAVPTTFTSSLGQYLPLLIPRVPPGTSSRRIYLSVPASVAQFELGAAIGSPWADDPAFRGCMAAVVSDPTCMGGVLTGIASYLAANPQIDAMSGTGVWAKEAWQCEGAGTLAAAIVEAEQALDHLVAVMEGGSPGSGCADALLPRWRQVLLVHVVSSIDPNDKLSPQGPVSSQQAIPYSVRFENLASAGASAQKVTITDVLATTLDLNSFTLDAVAFGSTRLVPPPGVKQYTWDVDLGPTRGIVVRVVAGFTPSTPFDRTVVWTFVSLDRTTGQPLDPASLNGFLPPNANPPEGEGSVLFTVRPSSSATNGTQIQNVATINFDGSLLTTPPVSNQLDSQAPASNVLGLGTPISDASFPVSWQGSGTGLRDYTIYVAEDAAPYQVWKQNTTSTSDTYSPRPGGHTYAFYSVARDMTGNIEAAPGSPDAQTFSTTDVGQPGLARLSLLGAQPNPARGVLRVGFSLPSREPATLELIDVAGRRVLRRHVGEMGPGSHMLTLGSTPQIKSGLYFVRLVQGERALESRVVLMR